METPVTFPPGRARLWTRPVPIGGPSPIITTVIVRVAPAAAWRSYAQLCWPGDLVIRWLVPLVLRVIIFFEIPHRK